MADMMVPPAPDGTDARAEGAVQEPTGVVISASDRPEAPIEERLKVGSDLHQKILWKLKERRDFSRRHCESRWDEWDRVREHQRMYIDLTRSARKADRTSDPSTPEMPFDRAVTIPLSYATSQVLMTQIMSIYGARSPMIQLSGVESDDVGRAWMMESVLDYDQRMTKAFTVMYAMFQNAIWYGSGCVYDSWEIEEGLTTSYEPLIVDGVPPELLRALLGPMAFTPMKKWGPRKEYNRWQPIDSYNMRPDPRVPLWRLQDGEFFGHKFKIGWNSLIRRSNEAGPYFNVEALRERGTTTTERYDRGYDPVNPREPAERNFIRDKKSSFYNCEAMTVDLIPEEWGIGNEQYPHKWQFAWAEDDIIIRAHPMSNDHNQFPYSVAETDPDFEATFGPGQMELIEPLQRFTNWMFNAYVENVVTMLNNSWVYSPRFIEELDMEFSGPGEHFRLTNDAVEAMLSGEIGDVRQFLFQVPVQDVTEAPYMNGVQYIFQMAQLATAANSPLSGIQLPTERSATEISTITAKATDRMAISAKLMDENAVEPMVFRSIMNRQQYTRLERYYRIVGERARSLGLETIWAGLHEIQGNFDYKIISGIAPEDPARSAANWINMLQTGGQIPQLQQPGPDGKMLDFRKVFEQIAKRSGIENMDEFYMDVNVVSNEEAAAQAQAGNLVPVDGALPEGQAMLPPGVA